MKLSNNNNLSYMDFSLLCEELNHDNISIVCEDEYKKLLENVENGLVFSRDGEKIWKCRNCGHIVIGKEAPEVCPVCDHARAYFEIKAENY